MELNEDELKKKAYLLASRLKNSGLDLEIISARLEKEGIPEHMVQLVLANFFIEEKNRLKRKQKPFFYVAVVRVGMGVLIALISWLVFPQYVIIPIGFIVGGSIAAIIAKSKKTYKT